MEEGSMRCDANISARPAGSTTLGTKVEVKNLNSIRNVKKAIEFEAERLIGILKRGEQVIQQTRSFDAGDGTTFALRSKEEANDYRYFPDPDLVPFRISQETIAAIEKDMPQLPEQRIARYLAQLGLSDYDARTITEEKEFSDYFERVTEHTRNYKAAANWMLGPIRSWLNETGITINEFELEPKSIADLIALTDEGKLNFSTASAAIFHALVKNPHQSAEQVALEKNLIQDANVNDITAWVEQVLNQMPDKVTEYRKGKKGLIGLFVGEVKKVSKGKADPKLTNELLLKKLQS
jgi:aspartyl-tRNA(Asn)/glutamyl-tRNA(Gln) amidotransferase subunit B